MKPRITLLLSFSLFLLLIPFFSNATHVLGGEIEYKDLGSDNYLVSVKVYRDCNGSTVSNSAIAFKGSCSGITKQTQRISTGKDITPVCANQCTRCTNSNCNFAYGIEEQILSVVIDVSKFKKNGCCNITIWWDECCRTGAYTTGMANQVFYIEAQLNVCLQGPNNSPIFEESPLSILCLGRDFVGYVGGKDPDTTSSGGELDSLVYSFTAPKVSAGTNASWASPYSPSQPIKYLGFPGQYRIDQFPFGMNLDSNSGLLMFRPMSIQKTPITIKAEQYRNGLKIGETTRELPALVIKCPNNSPPVISGFDCQKPISTNFIVKACVGQTICFDICTSDKDLNDTVLIDWDNGIKNGNFTITNKGDKREEATFCWTPTQADLSQKTHQFVVFAQDNACPSFGQASRVFTIQLSDYQKFDYDISNNLAQPQCGQIKFSGHSSDTLNSDEIYWYVHDTTLMYANGNTDTTNFIYNFERNGTYPITAVVIRGGCVYEFHDTVTVNNIKPIKLNVHDTSVCKDTLFTKIAKSSGGYGQFTYEWTPDFYINWRQNDTISETLGLPKVEPNTTRTYFVKATDSAGCFNIDTLHVYKKEYKWLNMIQNQLVCEPGFKLNLPTNSSYKSDWSGPGVTNNIFSNSGLANGIYQLNYYIEDDTACFDNAIEIRNSRKPKVNAGPDILGCSNMNNMLFKGTPSGGIWSGYNMRYDGYFQSNGRLSGNYSFVYTVKDSIGCQNSDSLFLRITGATRNLDVGNDIKLCNSDTPLLLQATPAGGYWNGNVLKNGSDFYFEPGNKTPSQLYLLEYVYTDSLGCKNSRSKKIEIYPYTKPYAGSDISKCFYGNETIQLTGAPSGGIWTGYGLTGKSGLINADSTHIGTNQYTYEYKDFNNCLSADAVNVTLNLPTQAIAGPTDTVCFNDKLKYLFNAKPRGG
ncbi:MAG: hypothetical protein KDC92_15110, partial [Bacteroidetes bacterium]|nr:hypothetical protein [Bacteroidota bacterium]